MDVLLGLISVSIALSLIVTLIVVAVRRDVFDRIIGIGVVGTKATVLLALVGALFGRMEAFVDLAITYALLNFTVTVAVSKYLARRQEGGA